MNKLLPALLVAPLLAAIGCDAPDLPKAAQAPAPAAEPAPAPEPKVEMVAGAPGEPLPEDETPVTDIPRKFNAHDPIQGRRSRQVAKEGVSLGIGATAAAGFYAKIQPMIFAIDEANNLYWPQHDFSYPKTQESFMKDVVALALNGIKLPDLPEDEEYCYVPSQPKEGLQMRLKPGSPRSKVPAGTSPEDAIKMLTGKTGDGEPVETPAAADQPAAEEPSPDIRTRAAQVGNQGNDNVEKHGLAPGGLAPVGGIGEDQ